MNKNAQEWYNKGITLGKLGKYDEAIKCYDKAIEIDPEDLDTWNNKGVALFNLGKYDEAIECYDKSIEINPEHVLAWILKGLVLEYYKKYDEAIECYDKAIEINPEFADAWNNKGSALDNLGKYDEAIKCYDKAIEINPEFSEAWYNKGNALKTLGKYDEAIECYDEAIEINPEDAGTWNNKGRALYLIGKYDEGIKCYDKAIEINPEDANTWNNKGLALKNLGKYDEGIKCYDRAIEINQKDADTWYNKGHALYLIGKYDESIKCCDKTIEINPKAAVGWNNKGLTLSKLGKYEEAIEYIDKAIEIDPRNANTWHSRGEVMDDLGKYDEALKYYDKALELDPQNANAIKGKEQYFSRMNISEEADEETDEPVSEAGCVKTTSAIDYKGAEILFKIKVENSTYEPIADIKISLHVPDVFDLNETNKTISILHPGEGETVTFAIRPTGECGNCYVSGTLDYYDYSIKNNNRKDIETKMLSIICPVLRACKTDEENWNSITSGLILVDRTKDVEQQSEILFKNISRAIKGMNMYSLEPEVDSRENMFNGVARFYAEGVKGLKYAAQVEVIGGMRKPRYILTAWAEKEDALTGFFYAILDRIEKRVNIVNYDDRPGTQINVQFGHNVAPGGKVIDTGDKNLNLSKLEEAIERQPISLITKKSLYCPTCGNAAEGNMRFCINCGNPLGSD
ncbi:MAG: tetratricopeptide repeat protein [Methanosarcinales archaeon]|nr:MAG: tetratricopeptide repeat protein [Methanosarcinales archaeon]